MLKNLQQSGRAFFVYLPSKWVKKLKLRKGDELRIESNAFGNLLLSPRKKKILEHKSFNLKANINSFCTLVTSLYVTGFEKATINFSKSLSEKEILKLKSELNKLLPHPNSIIIESRSATAQFPKKKNEDLLKLLELQIINQLNYARSKKYDKKELSLNYKREGGKLRFKLLRSTNLSFNSLNQKKSYIELSYLAQLSQIMAELTNFITKRNSSEVIKILSLTQIIVKKPKLDKIRKLRKRLADVKDKKVRFMLDFMIRKLQELTIMTLYNKDLSLK